MQQYDIDDALKEALSSSLVPSDTLNKKIKRQMEETSFMKSRRLSRVSRSILIAATLVLMLSATAFATWKYWSPGEFVNTLGENYTALADAFSGEDSLMLNQAKTSHGYIVTLHGVVSGAGLVGIDASLEGDSSYAVVTIEKEDGTPMPATSDAAYGQVPFLVSPLIRGTQPWRVNIFTLGHGGANTYVIDGIMYRLMSCSSLEMFADIGVSLLVSSTNFVESELYNYDPDTGITTANAEFDGVNIIFDLPLNKAKADNAKAQALLDTILNPEPVPRRVENTDTTPAPDTMPPTFSSPDLTMVPNSEKEVTYSRDGMMSYDFTFEDGSDMSCVNDPENVFPNGVTGLSDKIPVVENADGTVYIQYYKLESGVITAMLLY